MTRSRNRRLAATLFAGAALALTAVPALAVTPTVETLTAHREVPFVDCPGFTALGIWDIDHKLTYFYDSDGVATRDHDQVDFTRTDRQCGDRRVGPRQRIAHLLRHACARRLLPDHLLGQVRKSDYVHDAGRIDFQTGEFRGHDGFGPDNIAALCEALGG